MVVTVVARRVGAARVELPAVEPAPVVVVRPAVRVVMMQRAPLIARAAPEVETSVTAAQGERAVAPATGPVPDVPIARVPTAAVRAGRVGPVADVPRGDLALVAPTLAALLVVVRDTDAPKGLRAVLGNAVWAPVLTLIVGRAVTVMSRLTTADLVGARQVAAVVVRPVVVDGLSTVVRVVRHGMAVMTPVAIAEGSVPLAVMARRGVVTVAARRGVSNGR